jgi:hypothetical protein
MEVLYDEEALTSLIALRSSDEALGELVDRALDGFEAEPDHEMWKRRRYSIAATFGFTVRGHQSDALVIWQRLSELQVLVQYVGADF